MTSRGKFVDYITGGERGKSELGHGPFGEVSETYVDNVPWDMVLSNGIVREYGTGRVWKYFLPPEDVQTEWLTDPEQGLENQSFFLDLCMDLSKSLDNQVESLKRDTRRRFHSQTVRGVWKGIQVPKDFTPAHRDYMNRISQGFERPVWNTVFGVELLASETFYEAHGFVEHLQRWWDNILHPQSSDWIELAKDLQEVDMLFAKHGFREIDLIESPETWENMTSWHGIERPRYRMPRALRTSQAIAPVHGMSMILPRWGEVSFHALKPKDVISVRDPLHPGTSWAKDLYNPSHDVVAISIRGQIRSSKISANLLDLKLGKTKEDAMREAVEDLEDGAGRTLTAVRIARESVEARQYPMLDMMEIVVASRVPDPGKTNPLFGNLEKSGLDALLLKDRQTFGLFSTLPGYPRGVLRNTTSAKKRPHLSNVALPGFIGLSGLYRSTKPAASTGIFLGLSPAGHEYREIYTEMDAAAKYNRSPVILMTGRPGSGKTQMAIQMLSQMAYEELPVWFLNLKKTGTLKASFDLIGGYTISMDRAYLLKNPGVMDPKYFLKNPDDVAGIVSEVLFSSMRLYDTQDAAQAKSRRTRIAREILEHARDPRNKTTYDIFFGTFQNGQQVTEAITDKDVLNFVKDSIGGASPFWTAFVSPVPNTTLAAKVRSGGSFLIEWDGSMSLPDANKSAKEYTDNEMDMVNSAVTVFRYASENVSNTGGGIFVDESHAFKGSKEARRLLNTAAREWRQADIVLVMASQKLKDWLGNPNGGGDSLDDLSAFVERFFILAIPENDADEFEWFVRLTGQPHEDWLRRYLVNMGATKTDSAKGNLIPRAWIHDTIVGWSNPIICGPYPSKELDAGSTNKLDQHARVDEDEDYMKELEEAAREITGLTGKLALLEAESMREYDLPDDLSDL